MAEAGDGKTSARLGYESEAKQLYLNYILDANDEFNRIQDKRIQDRRALDQYDSYTEQELLAREQALQIYDKQYESFNQGLEYIDRAAQTAFDQELLGYQQNLRSIETDMDNLQRQNYRTQLEAAYADANLRLNRENIGYDISNQRLANDNIRNQIANQGLALDNLDLQISNNRLQQNTNANNMRIAARDGQIIQNSIRNNIIDGQEIQRESQRLMIQDRNRREQYGVQMNQQTLQMQKQASEARLSMLTETLKGQAAAGQAGASGRRGNAARGAIQSATTLSSINSQAVADNLMRGAESMANAVAGLTSENQSAEQISASQQETLAGRAQQNLNDRDSLGLQLEQNQLKIDNLKNQNDEIVNNRNILRNQKKEINNNIKSTENNLKAGQNKVEQLKNNKQSVTNNINEVAAMLGISQEQFEADTETLSQMYADQLPAFENIVERISNSVYKDKTNLFNKMPLPPKFASLADPPYEVPLAGVVPRTLLDPNQYDSDQFAIPKPPSGGGSGGLFGSIGAVLGMAAGALLAPATGGASLIASAQLGGAIGGGLGSVADAFSY